MITFKYTGKDYFLLYANALIVEGAVGNILLDLHTNRYIKINKALSALIAQARSSDIDTLFNEYKTPDYREKIIVFFDFLIENDFGFYTAYPEQFPDMDLTFNWATEISNAIIDYNGKDEYVKIFIEQLDEQGCQAVQVRCFEEITYDNVSGLLEMFLNSRCRSVELIIPFSKEFENPARLKKLAKQHGRLTSITVFNSAHEQEIQLDDSTVLTYSESKLYNEKSCGIFREVDFLTNLSFFTESQHHNTCLNRKVSIDTMGNIKNCPSMERSFGNIKSTWLKDVIRDPEFTRYWNIRKDEISVCKDCEFRHICMDCRAYTENPEDLYSKPLKCGYDPYNGTWEPWSSSPLKQKAIQYFGMEHLAEADRQKR